MGRSVAKSRSTRDKTGNREYTHKAGAVSEHVIQWFKRVPNVYNSANEIHNFVTRVTVILV